MREFKINENEAGQRFDKYLFKYFKEASSGFIYKMLRKKNITLLMKYMLLIPLVIVNISTNGITLL